MPDPVYFSINNFPTDGIQTVFQIAFAGGYIDRTHVKADFTDALGVVTPITITSGMWVGPLQINFTPALAAGGVLTIYRDTPKDVPIVDFTNGAIMNEPNLDRMADQAVFVAAEMVDQFHSVQATSQVAHDTAIEALDKADEALGKSNQAIVDSANALAGVAGAQAAAILATEAADAATIAANEANQSVIDVTATAEQAEQDSAQALSVANAIDGKAQAALDASAQAVQASSDAQDTADGAVATANGIDAKATQALEDSGAAVAAAANAEGVAAGAVATSNRALSENYLNTPPASPVLGEVWANPTDGKRQRWDGTVWKPEGRVAEQPLYPGDVSDVPMGTTSSWLGKRASIPAGYIPNDGQEVSQALYPEFYAMLTGGAFTVVTEASWQATPANRASFVLTSSTGKFRMPDLNGMSSGSYGRVFVGGDGLNAAAPGVIQEDRMQRIMGEITAIRSAISPLSSDSVTSGAFKRGATTAANQLQSIGGGGYSLVFDSADVSRTASRGNPVNTAGVWITKVADVAVNPGTVDIVALAAQASATDAGLQALDGELDFTIIYPNGGTEVAPANVAVNSRYVMANPFPGYFVMCQAEVLKAGVWGNTGYVGGISTTSAGVTADQLNGGDLIIQTGLNYTALSGTLGGSPLPGAPTDVPLPCRVKVWKLKGAI